MNTESEMGFRGTEGPIDFVEHGHGINEGFSCCVWESRPKSRDVFQMVEGGFRDRFDM